MIDLGWYFDHIFLLGCPIEVISEALESLFKDLQIIFHNIFPNLDVSGVKIIHQSRDCFLIRESHTYVHISILVKSHIGKKPKESKTYVSI